MLAGALLMLAFLAVLIFGICLGVVLMYFLFKDPIKKYLQYQKEVARFMAGTEPQRKQPIARDIQ